MRQNHFVLSPLNNSMRLRPPPRLAKRSHGVRGMNDLVVDSVAGAREGIIFSTIQSAKENSRNKLS